jgi:hypothetical protein
MEMRFLPSVEMTKPYGIGNPPSRALWLENQRVTKAVKRLILASKMLISSIFNNLLARSTGYAYFLSFIPPHYPQVQKT